MGKEGVMLSSDYAARIAKAAYEAEQRRKERSLMSDTYNLDCSRNPPSEPFKDEVSANVNKPAIDATLNERGSRYGAFTGHAAITQGLKSVMKATPKWAALHPDQKEALEMVQHKIGRILNGDPDYHDSWHDIVGYAKLVADRLEGVRR